MTSVPPEYIRQIEDPGCQQLVGYRTEMDQRDGSCRVMLELMPHHLNRNGVLHGGIVAMLLDVVCGNTASAYFDHVEHPSLVTVSLNTSYVAATRGGRVTATAQAMGGGRSIAYVNGELRGEDGVLLATAAGVFKRIRRSDHLDQRRSLMLCWVDFITRLHAGHENRVSRKAAS